MQELINSFIIQSKECRLRGIGKFQSVIHPAQGDIASKQITPPVEEKIFTPKEERISDELVKYAAAKNNISIEEAFEKIKEWCAETRSKLKNGEEIFFPSLGFLKTNQSGNISFQALKVFPFYQPITVERVVHKNSTHNVLVGDKETNSSVMTRFYNDEEMPDNVKKNTWKMISIALFVIALLLLIFYFYTHSFSVSGIGTQVKVTPKSPPATYSPQ